MREHHRRAVERLTEALGGRPEVLAVLLGGSLARGTERDDSDVDLVLVVDDAEFARREARGDLVYRDLEVCDWPGGYAEGKVVPLRFLEEVAERGSEPARAAFVGARVLHARLEGLGELLERITRYPDELQTERIASFHAQLVIQYWYLGEGEKRGDRYLVLRSAAELALFAGRLVLAHNRVLFPYHKWFMHELRRAPERPEGLLAAIEALLEAPCVERANPVLAAVLNFRDWGCSLDEAAARFVRDSEWSWRDGPAPVADR